MEYSEGELSSLKNEISPKNYDNKLINKEKENKPLVEHSNVLSHNKRGGRESWPSEKEA